MEDAPAKTSRFQRPESTDGLPDLYADEASMPGSLNLPDSMKLLTYSEAAKVLRVCQKTIHNLCRVRQEIPVVRIGCKPFIRLSDLHVYIGRGGSEPQETIQQSDNATDGRPNNLPKTPQGSATAGTKEMSEVLWQASSAGPTAGKASNL